VGAAPEPAPSPLPAVGLPPGTMLPARDGGKRLNEPSFRGVVNCPGVCAVLTPVAAGATGAEAATCGVATEATAGVGVDVVAGTGVATSAEARAGVRASAAGAGAADALSGAGVGGTDVSGLGSTRGSTSGTTEGDCAPEAALDVGTSVRSALSLSMGVISGTGESSTGIDTGDLALSASGTELSASSVA
jgi:hypothetical protein